MTVKHVIPTGLRRVSGVLFVAAVAGAGCETPTTREADTATSRDMTVNPRAVAPAEQRVAPHVRRASDRVGEMLMARVERMEAAQETLLAACDDPLACAETVTAWGGSMGVPVAAASGVVLEINVPAQATQKLADVIVPLRTGGERRGAPPGVLVALVEGLVAQREAGQAVPGTRVRVLLGADAEWLSATPPAPPGAFRLALDGAMPATVGEMGMVALRAAVTVADDGDDRGLCRLAGAEHAALALRCPDGVELVDFSREVSMQHEGNTWWFRARPGGGGPLLTAAWHALGAGLAAMDQVARVDRAVLRALAEVSGPRSEVALGLQDGNPAWPAAQVEVTGVRVERNRRILALRARIPVPFTADRVRDSTTALLVRQLDGEGSAHVEAMGIDPVQVNASDERVQAFVRANETVRGRKLAPVILPVPSPAVPRDGWVHVGPSTTVGRALPDRLAPAELLEQARCYAEGWRQLVAAP